MKPIPFSEIKNLPDYNGDLDRPSAPLNEGIYRVMLWDDLHDLFTIFRFRRVAEADAKFRSLLIDAQKQGCCVRILIVAPDDFEVQRVELCPLTPDYDLSWANLGAFLSTCGAGSNSRQEKQRLTAKRRQTMKNQFVIINHLIIDKSKLNHDQKLFVNAVERANTRGENLRIYPNYSGRGMFGDCCVGVTGARSSTLPWRKKQQSYDSMGLGQIIYFRGIPALPRDSFCDHHDLIETITDYRDSDDPDEIEEVEKAKATLRRFNYEELTGRTL